MEAKQMKTVRFPFDAFSCKAAEEFLNEMSKKGWRLTKVLGRAFTFTRQEASEERYRVLVVNEAEVYEFSPTEDAYDFAAYCEKAGWEFITSVGKIYYFRTSNPECKPIFTEPQLELKSVIKATLQQKWPIWMIGIYLLYAGLRNGLGNVAIKTQAIHTLIQLGMLIVGIMIAVGLVDFGIWFLQTRNMALTETAMRYRNQRQRRIRIRIQQLIAVIGILAGILMVIRCGNPWLLGVLALEILIALLVRYIFLRFLEHRNVEEAYSSILGMVIVFLPIILFVSMMGSMIAFISKDYDKNAAVLREMQDHQIFHDEMPLHLSDLGIVPEGTESCEYNQGSSLALPSDRYTNIYVIEDTWEITDELEYTVYYGKSKGDLTTFLKSKGRAVECEEISEEERTLWHADSGMAFEDGSTFYLYGTTMLQWRYDKKLTDEQIVTALEKLGIDY